MTGQRPQAVAMQGAPAWISWLAWLGRVWGDCGGGNIIPLRSGHGQGESQDQMCAPHMLQMAQAGQISRESGASCGNCPVVAVIGQVCNHPSKAWRLYNQTIWGPRLSCLSVTRG